MTEQLNSVCLFVRFAVCVSMTVFVLQKKSDRDLNDFV